MFESLDQKSKQSPSLTKALRHLDYTINVNWVMAHYKAAKKYIESSHSNGQATGGSDWKKYMLPKYQKRIFFPSLWTQQEIDNWGIFEYEALENVAV
jgi:tryptophan 2,3-dioxygenase